MISAAISLALLGMAPSEASPAPVAQISPPAPPQQPKGATRAIPRVPLAWLIGGDDYPATQHGEEGSVRVRLDVGVDGRVSACTITQSSGFRILDSTSCRLLTSRARFAPARDGEGRPVPDSVPARIVWLDEKEWPPGLPALFVSTMRATPDGKVSCSYVVNGSEPAPERCSPSRAARMSEHARATGRVADQTEVIMTTPEGDADPPGGEDHGPLAYDWEVALSVAPDGSILECRAIREVAAASTEFRSMRPCEGLEPGVLVFEPEPGPPRKITLKNRIFERW